MQLGSVQAIDLDGNGCTLTIGNAAPVLDDCHIGDSIAVNGACLTVTEFDKEGWFKVWLANETLQRTNLGELKVGNPVNLERAVGTHVRFGGHFVQVKEIYDILVGIFTRRQAHVDSTATIIERVPDGDSVRLTFQLEEATLLPYLIPKGYVALDGVSLTLTGVDDAQRRFGIIGPPQAENTRCFSRTARTSHFQSLSDCQNIREIPYFRFSAIDTRIFAASPLSHKLGRRVAQSCALLLVTQGRIRICTSR